MGPGVATLKKPDIEVYWGSGGQNASNTTSYTWTGKPLVDPSPDRIIMLGFVIVTLWDPGTITVKVGGVTATRVKKTAHNGTELCGWAMIEVPNGTTGNVEISCSGFFGMLHCRMRYWRVYNAKNTWYDSNIKNQATGATRNLPLDVSKGGAVFAVEASDQDSRTVSWTGIEERWEGAVEARHGSFAWSLVTENEINREVRYTLSGSEDNKGVSVSLEKL